MSDGSDQPAGRDRALEELMNLPEVRKTLSELGIFVRNLKSGDGFANYLWKIWGYAEEEMVPDVWRSIVHPDDRQAAVAAYEKLLSGEISTYRQTYRIQTRSGDWRWVVTSGRVVAWDTDGRPELYVGADVDITEGRNAESALEQAIAEAEEEAQEAETLRMAGAIVASTLEIEKAVQLVLDQALQVVPYDTAAVLLLREDALEVVGGNGWEDIDAVKGLRIPVPGDNPHSQALERGNSLVIEDLENDFPKHSNISGTEIRGWLGVPLVVHGEKIGLLAMDSAKPGFFTPKHVRLATALGDNVAVALYNARLFEQTKALAMTDSLTGTATRRSFFFQAERALERARRTGNPLSVLMADLDHFKEINDRHGHATGDEMIRQVAESAREVLRRSEIIGRYGGEEFAVVLPDTDESDALIIAERIRSRVSGIIVPGEDKALTISIGVTTRAPEEIAGIDAVLDEADKALFVAKRLGRNRVEIFQPGST
jgi:diguanylate cyclase (GGDEF)-like protein/PAS domain S-box-containing protein